MRASRPRRRLPATDDEARASGRGARAERSAAAHPEPGAAGIAAGPREHAGPPASARSERVRTRRPTPCPSRAGAASSWGAHARDGGHQHHPRLVRRARAVDRPRRGRSISPRPPRRRAPTSSISAPSRRVPARAPCRRTRRSGGCCPRFAPSPRASRLPVSVDTRKAAVARAALDEGASIVNDISGLRYDAGLGAVVARAGAGLVLMHMRGTSARDVPARPRTRTSPPTWRAELAESPRARRRGLAFRARPSSSTPGSGSPSVRNTATRRLRGCAELAALDRPAAGRDVAEVVPARRPRRVPADRRADWGTAACGCRGDPRGGAHRARARRRGDGAGGAGGGRDQAEGSLLLKNGPAKEVGSSPNSELEADEADGTADRTPIPCCSSTSVSSATGSSGAHRLDWWDVVDILIVAVAIYEILKLIRGTRAVQMALGAGLLLALFYVSRLGHLETVNWLIRNMVGYVVFALIVLFQADIRRTLAHFGRTPFAGYFGTARSRRRDASRSWPSPRRCWPASGPAPSSPSSATSGCATTSRAASRSTRRSPTTCSSRSSGRGRRCTTARSSCRATGWRRPPASCR